jgi:DNA-binding MarR family transcriptional regulator
LKLDDSIGFLVNYTGRKISQLLTTYFEPYHITPEQWTVLNRLYEQEGITQKDLAQKVGKDQTNVTRILDQLERKALIKRTRNEKDRRSFLAYVTKKGKTLIETLLPIEEEVLTIALENISEEQISLLKQILAKITENINRHVGREQ